MTRVYGLSIRDSYRADGRDIYQADGLAFTDVLVQLGKALMQSRPGDVFGLTITVREDDAVQGP